MNRAIAWFAENHVAANLLMTLMIVAGILAIPALPQEMMPDIQLDMLSVTVPYPGASPEEVEESVVLRIEDALQGLSGVKRLRSTASESVGSVTIELIAGEDVRARLDDVRAQIDAIDSFPDEAEEPQVREVEMSREVLSVAVAGEADEGTIKRLAEQLRDELSALPGITNVGVVGARDYEVSIEVSEASLRRYGISFDDVAEAVRRSSLDLPGGTLETDAGEIRLRAIGQAYDGADFDGIAIRTLADGSRLKLADVARVTDGFEDSDRRTRFDGGRAVMVQVMRTGRQKSLEISEVVREHLVGAQARMPAGITLTAWNDEASVLGDRLGTMLRNARGGFVLVVLCLALFLRLRLAVWVSVAIPITFLGTLAALPFVGATINFVSLIAFIVVLGIVVDDSIVVGENVHAEQEQGGSLLAGAIRGAQNISVPVVFGVLTTMAAFAPMLFLPGPMGRATAQVPLVVIACLVFSLVESLWVLPSHLAHGVSPTAAEGEPRRLIPRLWKRLQDAIGAGLQALIHRHYARALRAALGWRYLTVAVAVGLFVLVMGALASGWLRFVFASAVESDRIAVSLIMPEGTPPAVTADALERIEAAAIQVASDLEARQPVFPIVHRLNALGVQPSSYQNFFGTGSGGGGHLGEVQVQLVPPEERSFTAGAFAGLWRDAVGEIPGAEEISYQASMVIAGSGVEVELSGLDLGPLTSAASAVRERLATYPGVFDVTDSFRGGEQELELRLLPSAESLGLSLRDLARQVRQGFYGEEVQRIQRGRDEVKVMLRYPAEQRSSLTDIERMRIRTPEGSAVPFSSVASIDAGRGPSSIERLDRRRVITITSKVDTGAANPNEIARDLRRKLPDLIADFPGVTYSFEGEQADQVEFLGALGRGQLIALLVIYALLAVPLRSYLQPLIIMSAIPFGIVGAAVGHLLLGFDLNMYSVVGLVALSGIVVNASLVLVDAVNRRLAQGAGIEQAVLDAARTRFRPIMLTSLTTFAGLTPMMLETSMQAMFMIPMAISIAFGVVFASLITLFLVPCGYLILDDLSRLARPQSREEVAAAPAR